VANSTLALLAAPEGFSGQYVPPRSGGLENTTDNFSAPCHSSDARWFKLEWLRVESTLRRQRICMTRAYARDVSVRRGSTSIGFGGLMACGSRACPVCGPNLAAQNRSEIVQAVRSWREGDGGTVLFGTFTVRHRLGQSFEELKAGVSAGWNAVTSGRGWIRDRREHGVEHWVRVFEEKWSPETGWHLHIHYLVFVRPGHDAHATELLESMFGRWRRSALSLGLGTPALVGQDLHDVTGENADIVLGDYFTKQIERSVGRTAVQLGLELTNRDGKFTGESFTPGELLTLAVAGMDDFRLLWGEYERGMQKRRVIAFSRDLREAVGLLDEVSDIDAALVEGEELRKTIIEMRAFAFRKVVGHRLRRELLQRAWASPEMAVAWLEERGIPAVLGGFDHIEQPAGGGVDYLGVLPW
jgi:hypothetical protein